MRGISFPEQTVIFGKPETWKDEDCYGLPVNQGYYVDSEGKPQPCLHSVWELTTEDLKEINRTGKIYLRTSGTGMPPVSIHVENEIYPDEPEIIRGMIFHNTGQFVTGEMADLSNYREWLDALHAKQKAWAELKIKPE